ncbi:MAG TPA: adenylate/guanylate cyclase domain-containing protein [Myxococcales bacterium]|nr:adenylate/guanylate cyclase domain-containing protein [Myxococcales bacterium]
MASETTIARAVLARQQELQVLAEANLSAERRVVFVRLLVFGLVGLAAGLKHPGGGRVDPWMLVAVPCYGTFTAVALWRTLAAKANFRRALFFNFFLPTVDFAFLAVADWRTLVNGTAVPEHAAALGALFMTFALLRTPGSIVYSTALAVAAYLALALLRGTATSFGTLTVLASFLSLGVLLWRSNLALGKMFVSLRRRDNLSRFLAAPLVERLLAGGEAALQPVQREVTVLFLDVRNFTGMSEHLAPREVLEFLDDLLGRMAHIVKAHDGIVNKFLGDGMLAFWGVPSPKADHARAALRAALDMRRDLEELNGVRERRGQAPIRIGIGIHTGLVAAGMLGGADQHEYTVIGDSVNLASRIESLTKQLGVDILVSQSAWQSAGPGFSGGRMAEERVKGREEAVVVHALDAYAGTPRQAAAG